jgi:hypothetical protein
MGLLITHRRHAAAAHHHSPSHRRPRFQHGTKTRLLVPVVGRMNSAPSAPVLLHLAVHRHGHKLVALDIRKLGKNIPYLST